MHQIKVSFLIFKELQILGIRWTSGEIEEHLTNSLNKALKSIGWNHDSTNINIVMAESCIYNSIDFGNVIFGDEHIKGKHIGWNKGQNGIIHSDGLRDKLNSYIVLRRKLTIGVIKKENYNINYVKYKFF